VWYNIVTKEREVHIMIYRTFTLVKTFEAGLAVARVSSTLVRGGAGEIIHLDLSQEDAVVVEVGTYNHLVMAWVEDQFAPYV
jgi:hypothetical protein